MQLRQAKAFGMLDDHDRGVGNVDTDLDHRGGHQDIKLTLLEVPHDRFLFGGAHPPVQQADPAIRQLRAQLLDTGRSIPQVTLF